MDIGSLQGGAGAEVRRQVLDLLSEFRGRARLGAFVDHVGHELGQAGFLLWVAVDAVQEAHLDGDQWQRAILDDQHPRAVLELALQRDGRIEVRLLRERRRRLRPESRVRHQRRLRLGHLRRGRRDGARIRLLRRVFSDLRPHAGI